MPDWTQPMTQTYEYYVVDPGTWKNKQRLRNVISCTINRDSEVETLGSASMDITGSIGECYIRAYLVTTQDDIRESHPLGTNLVQTPTSKFDGRVQNSSMDAYTPLLELKENSPPLGYSILKGENIMEMAYKLIREHARAPVVRTECSDELQYDFVSNTNDTWITFISDLIAEAKYELALDELGRIIFAPIQQLSSLQPIYTYTDDNSSILQPEITTKHDIYGIQNVVEINYYSEKLKECVMVRVVNDDENSPVSTIKRGREIVYTETATNIVDYDDREYIVKQLTEYANSVLKNLSSVQYTVTYTHGYNGVRLGDCVRLNYKRAKLTDIKAKVISQSIKCESGCQVSETAIFTKRLWG